MKKGFNWGHGLTIFILLFIATLVFVVIKSFSVDRTLVLDDYYAQDLAYQQYYDKTKGQLAKNNLVVDKQSDKVVIKFTDASQPSGQIQFYRPSDKSKDFVVDITSNTMLIPTTQLSAGKWVLKIDWSQGGSTYYREENLLL